MNFSLTSAPASQPLLAAAVTDWVTSVLADRSKNDIAPVHHDLCTLAVVFGGTMTCALIGAELRTRSSFPSSLRTIFSTAGVISMWRPVNSISIYCSPLLDLFVLGLGNGKKHNANHLIRSASDFVWH